MSKFFLAGLLGGLSYLAWRKPEVSASPGVFVTHTPISEDEYQATLNQLQQKMPTIVRTTAPTGQPVDLVGDFSNPAGNQVASVIQNNTVTGYTFGGWDPSIDYSNTVAVINQRLAENPHDSVAVAQLAVMTELGLKGT